MPLLPALWALAFLVELVLAHRNYIVIVDCGSTGSRAHLFAYPDRIRDANTTAWRKKIVSGSPVSYPTEIGDFKSRPGISSFVGRPSSVTHGIRDIVLQAADAVRERDRGAALAEIPIYLGATAGMRVLTDAQRDAIMEVIRGFLGGPDCPFGFSRPEQARTLSGEEEGAFGWLAANHKMGTLTSDPAVAYGALDMGGDSTQISFIPYETSVLAHMFPIHIGNFKTGPIHLYTHSFLRFGYAAAFKSSALLASIGSSTFTHPCLPRGLVWHVEEGEFGIGGAEGKPERKNGPVTMSGGGNFWQCQELARSLMIQSYCTTLPCAILGVYRPALSNNSFLAFSEFKKNFDRMNITTSTVAPPLKALGARLVTWCSMTAEEQAEIAREDMGTTKAKIELSCWLGTWILEFLVTGLGFPEDTRNIRLYGSDWDIGWAQGQAIYETSYFPYKLREATKDRERVARQEAREGRPELAGELDEEEAGPLEGPSVGQPPRLPCGPLVLACTGLAAACCGMYAGVRLEQRRARGSAGACGALLLG